MCCCVDMCLLTCCATVWCVCLNRCVGLCNWLAGRGGRQPQPAQPFSTLLCAHTRAYTFSAMAAGGGDGGGGGGGGSKIKLKIKACPESPSAPRPAGSRGGCSSSPSEATRAGASCLSVSLYGCPTACQPCTQIGPKARSLHRSISDQWGQRGARGRARSKGPQETDTGTETETRRCRDRDRETRRQECGAERHRDPET